MPMILFIYSRKSDEDCNNDNKYGNGSSEVRDQRHVLSLVVEPLVFEKGLSLFLIVVCEMFGIVHDQSVNLFTKACPPDEGSLRNKFY